MLRIVRQSMHSCRGFPPVPPYGRQFVSAIYKVWHFFRSRSKRCHRRTRLTLPEGGLPLWTPPSVPDGTVRGSAPPPIRTAMVIAVLIDYPVAPCLRTRQHRCSAYVVSQQCCHPIGRGQQQRGGFSPPFVNPPRQGIHPLHPNHIVAFPDQYIYLYNHLEQAYYRGFH